MHGIQFFGRPDTADDGCTARSWLYGALGLAAFLLTGAASAAEPSQLEKLAHYEGPDRSEVILSGARKEGKLLIYTGVTSGVLEGFRKKYPWLTLETAQGDGPAHVRRMTEEYAAGRYLVDNVNTNNGALYLLKEAGHLQSFKLPSMAEYRKDAVEPNGYWVLSFEAYISLGYNTDVIPSSDGPRNLDDLLNPKWQGKFGVARTTLPNWIGAIERERGDKAEEFLRKFAERKMKVYQLSGRALANLVVSGEVPMTPAAFSAHMNESRSQGAKVGWRALDGVYVNVSSVSLAKRAPHPHAALLYLDFMTSHEGQLLHKEMGYASGRLDLQNPDEQPARRYYLAEEPEYTRNYERWEAMGRQIFGAAVADKPN